MKVLTARVVSGKIDIGEAELEEGAAVAVLVSSGEGFSLSETEEAELAAALAEIHEGRFTDGRELLRDLKDSNVR